MSNLLLSMEDFLLCQLESLQSNQSQVEVSKLNVKNIHFG
jgi:hypothetical protein